MVCLNKSYPKGVQNEGEGQGLFWTMSERKQLFFQDYFPNHLDNFENLDPFDCFDHLDHLDHLYNLNHPDPLDRLYCHGCLDYLEKMRAIGPYMGGTSQDVKGQKKWEFYPLILWVSLTIYIFFAFMKIAMCFRHLEVSHNMSCDS